MIQSQVYQGLFGCITTLDFRKALNYLCNRHKIVKKIGTHTANCHYLIASANLMPDITRNARTSSKTITSTSRTSKTENILRIPLWCFSLWFFSALCDFFEIFLVPLLLFRYFATLWMSKKIPKGPPFYIFRHCDTVQKSHLKFFSEIFQNLLSDPLQFFCHFLQPTGISQISKGPLLQFWALDIVDFGCSRLVSFSHFFPISAKSYWKRWWNDGEYFLFGLALSISADFGCGAWEAGICGVRVPNLVNPWGYFLRCFWFLARKRILRA